MKAIINLTKVTIEVEAETQKELFQLCASAYEVFGEKECGLCKSKDIIPVYRPVTQGKKVFEYPEMHCTNPACRARLSMGCMMEGGVLFPQRKLTSDGKPDRENGSYGPHRGWTKYKGEPKE